MLRPAFAVALLVSVAGCGDDEGPAQLASVEGDVLAFLTEVSGPRVIGATVSVLGRPELTSVTGDDAHFRFDGLEVGSRVTLVVEHPDFMPTRTATLTLGPDGIEPFPVQIVPTALFEALAAITSVDPELDRFCVVATTAARMGGSLYTSMRQGMPGATATTTPALEAESGPLSYPPAMVKSCKASFRNTWAFVDDFCDDGRPARRRAGLHGVPRGVLRADPRRRRRVRRGGDRLPRGRGHLRSVPARRRYLTGTPAIIEGALPPLV